jgi:hypothetical protein
LFLAFEFLGKFTLEALLFSGLQKERVFPYLFQNAFLLDPSLEATHGALDRFVFKNPNFSQNYASVRFCNRGVSLSLGSGESNASFPMEDLHTPGVCALLIAN